MSNIPSSQPPRSGLRRLAGSLARGVLWRRFSKTLVITIPLMLTAGCTFHPIGEREERQSAQRAGAPFIQRVDQRNIPDLPANPTPQDLVRRALIANANLERLYWDWRAA